MAKIERFGIKQPDGTFQYHDIGAKAENITLNNESLDNVIEDINTEIGKKFNSAGGTVTGEFIPAGGISYSGKAGYISFPDRNILKTVTNTTGQLKIYLPNFWCDTFIKFKISIANSSAGSSVDYFVSGYMDSAQQTWTQCTAISVGNYNEKLSNLNVGFGASNSACAITLGDVGTSWNYVTVSISDVTVSNLIGSDDYSKWSHGWLILINANSDILIKQTIVNPHVAEDVKELAINATDVALANAKVYTDQKIADLIDNAPETLDTLKEIANEIGDNQSAIDAMNTLIATKANKVDLLNHIEDTEKHITASERAKWNAKQDVLTIDSQISSTSTNPIQNKAVYNALEDKVSKTIGKELSTNDFTDAYKNKLDNIEENANKYIHPNSGVVAGTYTKVTVNAQGHVTTGSNPILTIEEGGTGATTAEDALQNLGLTATAAELNLLDGVIVTTAEINHLDGVTSNIQNQLDHKASLDTATSNENGLLSANDKAKLDTIEQGANKYIHPTHTSYASGLYNITVDGLGHVSGVKATTKSDITNLGIPAQDTTYKNATQSDAGLMSASDKAKLDGIDTQANEYILPVASTTLGGVKTTSTVNSISGYIATPIIDGVPYYKDTLYTLGSFGVTATADEINTLKNASSNIQTQINDTKKYVDTTKTGLIGDAETYTTLGKVEDKIASLDSQDSNLQSQITTNKNNLSNHVNNTTVHITAAERTKWNATQANAEATAKSYTDTKAVSTLSSAKSYTDTTAASTLASAKSYSDTSISNLINGAPATLDTLKEIADAMTESEEIVTALDEAIGTKANASDLTAHTGNTTVHITSTERTNWNDANSKKHTHNNKSILDNTTASYTTAEQTKLSGIATGAEVNVQSDWNATSGDAFIKNKPTFLTGGSQTSTSSADGGSNVYTFTKSDGTTTTLTVKNGSKGSTGATGATGPQGPKGDTGATGPQGPAGVNATTTSVATTSANGLMSSAMVTKLNGIATGANLVTKTSQLTNDSGFITSGSSITGNSSTSTVAAKLGRGGDTSTPMTFNWSGQSGQPTWLWGGSDGTNMYVYNPSNFNVNYAASSGQVIGSYTANGGQQNPNYFGTNKVGFLMMNTTVNGNSQYKDWIIMDCYSGSDVGGGVALGVNRQSLGAYIMRSAATRTSWAESAELLHTANYTSYVPKKDGTGASGTWGINISGTAAAASSVAWGNVSGKPSSFTPASHNQAASTITTGTFPGAVYAYANTAYTTNMIRNGVFTTTDPGAGASTSHANGSIIYVYE